MREALTTSSNSARAAVIDAIQSGEMLIVRSVSDDIKNLYPPLWDHFKAIKPRKYAHSTGATIDAATHLMERYGSSLLGSVPTFETFEALAIARLKKCKLVSGGKAQADCKKIASKCGLPSGSVVGITSI
jgi:hypothetical protein